MKKLTSHQLFVLKNQLRLAEQETKFFNLYDACAMANVPECTLYVVAEAEVSSCTHAEKLMLLAFLIAIGQAEELPETWMESNEFCRKY